jgi:hypothetical protein
MLVQHRLILSRLISRPIAILTARYHSSNFSHFLLLAYHSSNLPHILESSIPSLLAYHSSLTLSSRTQLRNFNSFSQLLSSYISSIIVAIFFSSGPGLLIVSPHKVIQNSLGQRRFLN